MHALAPDRVRAWPLATKVTLAVGAVVAAVSLLVCAATTSAVSSVLTDRLDDDLVAAHGRAEQALRRGVPPSPPRGAPPEIREARALEVGTLTAYFVDSAGQGQRIDADGQAQPLDDRALEQLREEVEQDGSGSGIHGVDLAGLGQYRLVATDVDGITVVTGLPTDPVDQTVSSLLVWSLLFALVATALAGAGTAFVVRRQLRPLREVAVTAHAVTETDLVSGRVEVPRVPAHLTAHADEVGQVSRALDAALGHVDEALAVRHRSEQQVRQFVADASHELRTPLATVRGYTDLALRPEADDETRVRSLDKVRVEAGRMQALVEDLLLLARLDQGRPLERAEVDLTHLVLESVADAQVTAPAHRWRMDLPDEPVTVTGDEARLHQVLTNLLSNAWRHTPEGTTVTVGLRRRGDLVEMGVHDDGPGIAPELVGEVFTRFTRGDSARTRAASGAGLGLALARSIIRAHGGDLTVASRPGDTTFTTTLPA